MTFLESNTNQVCDSARQDSKMARLAGGNFRNVLRVVCSVAVALELLALLSGVNGEVFAVGGAAGWTVPKKGMVNYTEWAQMLTSLNVGDTLLFTYSSGEHNVVQVEEQDFSRCDSTTPIATYTDGQTLVNLPAEGRYYFLCGFTGHCDLGQKLAIDVMSHNSVRAPAPAPTAGGTADPPMSAPAVEETPPSFSPIPDAFSPGADTPAMDNSARAFIPNLETMILFSVLSFLLGLAVF